MPDTLLIAALAFGAGMVAFFSPCCAAMLPAYVSYALGRSDKSAVGAKAQAFSRRRRELGALAVWGGLLVATLGLARIAFDALSLFGDAASESAAQDRQLSVALAAGGTLVALLGYAAIADRARFRRALLFGGLSTLGLLLVFGAFALPFAVMGRAGTAALPLIAAAVGVALVGVGILVLAHKLPTLRLPFIDPAREGYAGFFLYGVAYGLASLACTFPIFLAIAAVGYFVGPGALAVAVIAYALGKGTVLTLVTVLATASPTAAEGRLRAILPHFERIMAGVTIAAGAFLAYYFGVLYRAA